jgi:L-malate glycosyltransferase
MWPSLFGFGTVFQGPGVKSSVGTCPESPVNSVRSISLERPNSDLKILYISSASSLGGGERHLADLANGMVARNHDVFVALRPGSPLIAELRDVPPSNITELPIRNALDARSARELAKLVRQNGIQVVHAHMARDYPLAAYATRKNAGAALIVTRHVLFALNPLHRFTLGRAARVIAVSQAVATELAAAKIAPSEKITVVHNGIDSARLIKTRDNFDRKQFLEQFNLPATCLLVGIVGELSPLKGQAEFLKAAVEVAQQYPNVYFVVAGTDHSPDQSNSAALDELITRLRLSERVKRVPWLEDIAQLYCALDVFVSASHSESFGLAIAEAMACATPVVSTNTGGALEIIEPGKTGLLVPVGEVGNLAEAVVELLRNKSKRIAIGNAAQKAISTRFDVSRMIDETERIYFEEVAAGNPPKHTNRFV